ncbi:MAG TPA: NAD(P)-dependent methylenetetrahydromethanopterin dehydrogenase [Candidatus Lokiarchaeia archaeon]|nr:NAD(P)-dependent methylenetetrahydromethanopterin dehydrogenase [Candidatus Lokiarchaeia archaeon]
MATLELEAPENKKVKVVLVEYEHALPWAIDAVPGKLPPELFLPQASTKFRDFVVDLAKDKQPDVVCEELGLRTEEEFQYDNLFTEEFQALGIPYVAVDISENAKDYIESANQVSDLVKALNDEITEQLTLVGNQFKKDPNFSYLVSWYQYLKQQEEDVFKEVRYKVREAWMVMGLIDQVKKIEKDKVSVFLIADAAHFEGFGKLFEELGFKCETINIERKFASTEELSMDLMKQGFPIIDIVVKKPKKAAEKVQTILYFMDTDEFASPFDINMAYDAGFDVVVPLANVKASNAQKLTQDIFFSRGPDGANFTAIMVGGSNVSEAEKIFEVVQKSMFPPFLVPVFADPRGGYTTAAAAVVKVVQAFKDKGEDMAGKKVAVLGCGPVGRNAAMMLAKLGCDTVMVETAPSSAGFSLETAQEVADQANKMGKLDENLVKAAYAEDDDAKFEAFGDADAIISMGPPGIELVGADLLGRCKATVLCDTNAVKPLGIPGMKPSADRKVNEVKEDAVGIGSLALGQLKRDTEHALLKAAKDAKNKVFYDWIKAFEKASELLFKQPILLAPVEVVEEAK